MSTHKSKKIKKLKKHSDHEDDDDSEEEEDDESQNHYKYDDFVVQDDQVSEGEDERFPLNRSQGSKSEAELDESFASSDYEIIGKEKGKKKKLRKKNKDKNEKIQIKSEEHIKDEKEYQNELNDLDENSFDNKEKIKSGDDNFIANEDEDFEKEDYEMDEEGEAPRRSKIDTEFNSIPHQIFSLPEQAEDQIVTKPSRLQVQTIYSKEELEEQFATPEDNKIKHADYPERLLLRYKEEYLPRLASEIEKEADWLCEKLKIQLSSSIDSIQTVRKRIVKVLEYYKKEFLDAPYIVTYKRYEFEPELTTNDIWKLFEYDREWQDLSEYKLNVMKQFNVIKGYLDAKTGEFTQQRYIENAKSIDDLKAVEAQIKFLKEFHSDDQENKELQNEKKQSGYLRPVKKSLIIDCVKNKIHLFAERFAMKSHDLAVNLELILNNENLSKLIPAPEPEESLGDLAKQFLNTRFDQEIKIMEMSLKFLAQEMASHPFIRGYVWNYFRNNSYLSTEPTEKGKNELDVFNPSFKTKRIYKKPILQFNNDLYLDIVQAEEKGLIRTIIEVNENEESLKDIKNRLCNAYMPNVQMEGNEKNGWKIMREEAIGMLIDNVLHDQFLNEIKNELYENAEKYVINECGNTFYNMLSAGPYRKNRLDNNDDLFSDKDLPRVMSFVFDPNKKLVYCVILNKNGEVVDHYIFSNLAIRPPRNQKPEERQVYYDEQSKCKALIQQHKPALIIIGANDLRCRFLKDQIIACDPDMMKSEDSIWVTFGDLAIPSIYANSQYSEKAFPNYSIFLRQAVSLGRYQQNPLEEILQLWNEDINKNFCLKIQLHPLQRMVNQKKLMQILESKAIQVVNGVGVDINRAYEFSHLKNTLMFVSGLGPRKAQHILEKIIPWNGLSMRVQLVASSLVGKRVRTSCNGFIKLKRDISNDEIRKYDLLDMTRIPLDMYSLANKLIKSALEDENLKENIDPVEVILRDPKKLEILDCTQYIKKQTEGQPANIAHCLRFNIDFIKSELNAPFKDPRKEHNDLTPRELFLLLIGDDSFKEGQITVARVIRVDEQHVKCRLMNDLEATVWIKDVFEDNEKGSYAEMKARYKEGMIFEAKIKAINENNYKVDLITKPSEMRNHQQSMKVSDLDRNFKMIEEDFINKKYQETTREIHQKYIPRRIVHEKFKNVGCQGCIDYLRNRDIGDCLFRPSSRGLNNLTLTWKFYKQVYSHIDIVEEDKLPGTIISNKLRIGNEIYSSLSEISDRFVQACARLVKEVIQYRKFVECDGKSDLEKRLKADKSRDPSIIHYYLTILKDYPQYIILGYIPKTEMTCEYIRVKPSGFGFHSEVFKDIEDVITFFKKNYGTESYLDYVRKVRAPNVEFHRQIESKDSENNNWGVSDNNYGVVNNSSNSTGRSGNRDYSKMECHNCHEKGHIAINCPQKREGRGGRGRDGGDRFMKGKRPRSPRNNYDGGYPKRRTYDNNNNNNNSWGNKNESNSNNNSGGWGNNDSSGWGNADSSNNNNNNESGWGTMNVEVKQEDGWGTSDVKVKEEPKQEWGSDNNNGW